MQSRGTGSQGKGEVQREPGERGGVIMDGFLEEASEMTKSLRAQGSKESIQGGKGKIEGFRGVKGRQDWPYQGGPCKFT